MRFSERLTGENAVLTGNFLILLITWVLMNSTQPIAGTFSSKYFVSLGATPFILSMMFFVSSLAIAFVQFPGGYLADQHGRKWLVAIMTFGLSFGYLFLVFAPSWQWIVLGLVIQNLCLIYQPALMAMMIDSLDPAKRGTGLNFYSVVTGLVAIPAPLIAGALILVSRQLRFAPIRLRNAHRLRNRVRRLPCRIVHPSKTQRNPADPKPK